MQLVRWKRQQAVWHRYVHTACSLVQSVWASPPRPFGTLSAKRQASIKCSPLTSGYPSRMRGGTGFQRTWTRALCLQPSGGRETKGKGPTNILTYYSIHYYIIISWYYLKLEYMISFKLHMPKFWQFFGGLNIQWLTLFFSRSTLCSQMATHPKTLIETLVITHHLWIS